MFTLSVLGLLHRVNVGDVTDDVSEVHAASNFRVDVYRE
jgi:hypothetical protein